MGYFDGRLIIMLRFNYLKVLFCSVALCIAALGASAQVVEINRDFSSFDAIDVSYDFNVRMVSSRKNYSATLMVDSVLADYIQTYVKKNVLYITIDKKSLPSEVKKLYKGRKAVVPILNVVVSTPEPICSFKLADKSTLSVENVLNCKDFSISLNGLSRLKKLELDATNVSVNLADKSQAEFDVNAESIEISASGSSSAYISHNSEHLALNTTSNADLELEGQTLVAEVKADGASKTCIKGKTGELIVNGSGNANIDAINLRTSNATVKLSGTCKLTEAATEKLNIEMSGYSSLVFDGDPVINIVNIKTSSVSRYEEGKK